MTSPAPAPGTPAVITPAVFGENFFAHAVSAERIAGVLHGMLDAPITVGPLGAGPGRLARVSARGHYLEPTVARVGQPGTAQFRLTIPVRVTFDLDLRVETHRFDADVRVPVLLTASAADPLLVVVRPRAPRASEIELTVRGEGFRAAVLGKVVDVEHELRSFIARYVRRELAKPYVVESCTWDVAALMDRAWVSLTASGEGSGS